MSDDFRFKTKREDLAEWMEGKYADEILTEAGMEPSGDLMIDTFFAYGVKSNTPVTIMEVKEHE